MWYKIDFIKLFVQLLPPMLRSKFLVSLLKAMIVPLRYIYGEFIKLKGNADDRLNIACNVQYLEKALNAAFYLTANQIYIETPEEEKVPVFYFSSEMQRTNVIYLQSEGRPFVLLEKGGSKVLVNFIVKVPTFLCTSLESKDIDKFAWKHLSLIKNILKIYKPAGRTFSIELYDYE